MFGNNGPLLCQSSKEGGFGGCAVGAGVGRTKEGEHTGAVSKAKLFEASAGL